MIKIGFACVSFQEEIRERRKSTSLLFLRQPLGDFQVLVDFQVFIVNRKREACFKKDAAKVKFETSGRTWGWSTFSHRSNFHGGNGGMLQNDELTIFCEVVLRGEQTNKSGQFKLNGDKDSKSQQTIDLGQLLETKNFSDVVLVARDGEIHAHKAILALGSTVFAAMFKHDMVEKEKNRIEIVDIDHAVLQEMVQFIYTGKTPALDDEMAAQLLAAAEKYALEELKLSCEQSLSMNLTHDKVVDLIPLASMYGANQLKACLIDYLKMHLTDDAICHLWDNLISHFPNRAVDVICKSFTHKQVGS